MVDVWLAMKGSSLFRQWMGLGVGESVVFMGWLGVLCGCDGSVLFKSWLRFLSGCGGISREPSMDW